MNLDELLMGITIQISGRAILRDVPVGIGTSFTGAASAVSYGDAESVEFDLLPYGLVLAEPATVSVEIDGENPVVERYDEESGAWETIAGASCADGLVNLSDHRVREIQGERRTGNSARCQRRRRWVLHFLLSARRILLHQYAPYPSAAFHMGPCCGIG